MNCSYFLWWHFLVSVPMNTSQSENRQFWICYLENGWENQKNELYKGNRASGCKFLLTSEVIETQCFNCLHVHLFHLIVELKLCTLVSRISRMYRGEKPDKKSEVLRTRCWEGGCGYQTLSSWRGLVEFLELPAETSDGLGSKTRLCDRSTVIKVMIQGAGKCKWPPRSRCV